MVQKYGVQFLLYAIITRHIIIMIGNSVPNRPESAQNGLR